MASHLATLFVAQQQCLGSVSAITRLSPFLFFSATTLPLEELPPGLFFDWPQSHGSYRRTSGANSHVGSGAGLRNLFAISSRGLRAFYSLHYHWCRSFESLLVLARRQLSHGTVLGKHTLPRVLDKAATDGKSEATFTRPWAIAPATLSYSSW